MRRVTFLTCLMVAIAMSSTSAAQTYEEQVLEIVNQERWDNGQLSPLKGVQSLDTCSGEHSTAMAEDDFFGHCNPHTGSSPFDRMTAAGYIWNWAGENIAAGYSSPQAAMTGWMGSSGHRANILSTDFYEIGIGYFLQSNDQSNLDIINQYCDAYSSGGPYYRYWTQNFGRRSGVYPVVVNREVYSTSDVHADLYVYGQGWASEMRFQNENGPWSVWEPFAVNKSWTLSAGNGTKTVHAEIKNAVGATKSASDTIELEGSVTAVGDKVFPVRQSAFPNPFRQSTTLRFNLDEDVLVRVQVIDLNGRVVQTLQQEELVAGPHQVTWDGRDRTGRNVADGMYFIHLVAGKDNRVAKVILRR